MKVGQMIEFTSLPGIHFGSLTLNAHGLFIAIGIAAAYFVFNKKVTQKELLAVKDELLAILVISGVIGARLLYVATNLDFYLANPSDIIKIWEGGISFLGGLVFAIIASYLYLKHKKIDPLKAADSLVIPVVVAHFVGRVGDVLAWDHPGTYSKLPWSFLVNGQPQHPAIAYEMLGLLVTLGILYFASKKRIFEGKLLFTYLGLYGLLRLIVDQFRAEPTYFGFRLAQTIGLLLLVISVVIFVVLLRRGRKSESNAI